MVLHPYRAEQLACTSPYKQSTTLPPNQLGIPHVALSESMGSAHVGREEGHRNLALNQSLSVAKAFQPNVRLLMLQLSQWELQVLRPLENQVTPICVPSCSFRSLTLGPELGEILAQIFNRPGEAIFLLLSPNCNNITKN